MRLAAISAVSFALMTNAAWWVFGFLGVFFAAAIIERAVVCLLKRGGTS